ncbi:hypothetical protein ASE98_21275 [Pseudomonas sp. Leaf48]|uniref:hypothetical protein n=1 Tax=Pseudomonas sp. Leaf48 TaxID=1736221 RepID=UPI0007249F7C|nr:hypothetical protein [Pseudomonas sp. Leaf48]KQN52656.1 hypothetical protein ASE98_21275 [Pseudomonas sp. Leaf48]
MKGVLYIGVSFSVKMFCALAVLRFLAIKLGAEGFGYITQFMAFMAIVFGLSLGGAINYLVNRLSQTNDVISSEKEISVVFSYGIIFLFLLALLMIGFKGHLETYIFFGEVSWFFLLYCLLVFYISNIYGCLMALALAKKRLKLFAFSNVAASMVYLFIIFVAVETDSIKAIYWIMPLSYALPVLFLIRSFPERIRLDFKGLCVDGGFFAILKYCVIVYAGLASLPFVGILVRELFLQLYGGVELSNWQVAVKFSDTMQQFYGLFCSAILLPYFTKNLAAISWFGWQRKLIAISVVYLAVAVSVFYLRDIIVHLLFGGEYKTARNYFSYYLIGDYFRGVALFCSFTLISAGRYSGALLFEVLQGVLFFVFYHLLQSRGNVEGVGLSYVVAYVVCASVMCMWVFCYFKRRQVENSNAV